MGSKSEADCRLAGRKFARALQKVGFAASFEGFEIRNLVANVDLGFMVRLEGIAARHGGFAAYEPELFPGLVYRILQPKVVSFESAV